MSQKNVLVGTEEVTRMIEVVCDRWSSNPELVLDVVLRFGKMVIPEHPLVCAKTLRERKAAQARTRFVVVEREQLRSIEWAGYDEGWEHCPVCKGIDMPEGGHTSDCWLGNALKEV